MANLQVSFWGQNTRGNFILRRSGSERNVDIYWGYVKIDDGLLFVRACANSCTMKMKTTTNSLALSDTHTHSKSFGRSH